MSEEILKHILDKLSAMDNKLEKLERTTSALQQGQDELRQATSGLQHTTRALQQGQDDLRQTTLALQQGQDELKQTTLSLQQGQDELRQTTLALQQGQDELKQITTALRHGQEVTHAKLEALTMDVRKVQGALIDTKDTLHTFRSETDVNFRKLDRRIKLIESDLDETMSKVAEITLPKN